MRILLRLGVAHGRPRYRDATASICIWWCVAAPARVLTQVAGYGRLSRSAQGEPSRVVVVALPRRTGLSHGRRAAPAGRGRGRADLVQLALLPAAHPGLPVLRLGAARVRPRPA